MDAGAWDVARAERPGCMRPGAPSGEALECLQAFGLLYGITTQVVVSDAPGRRRASATRRNAAGPCGCSGRSEAASGREHAADATLGPEGTRPAPCPHRPIPPVCDGKRQTVPVRHPRRRPL